jgi:hypothetical protein
VVGFTASIFQLTAIRRVLLIAASVLACTADLVELGGGSGVDNTPNWAPDGVRFAFVSYRMLPEEDKGSTE